MGKWYDTFKEYLDNEYKGPFIATDIIIEYNDGNKDGIVLIDRKNIPYGLALPGGIAEHITFEENAVKEAKEETGLEVILRTPNRPFCVFSDPEQDPRAFIAAVVYIAEGYGTFDPHPEEDARSAKIYSLDELRGLLDSDGLVYTHHRKILEMYLDHRNTK